MNSRKMLMALSLVATVSVLTVAVWAQPPGGRGAPAEPMRIPLMTALDTNGDGDLSAEEIAGASQALKKLDKNGDGKVSREELRPQFGGRGGPGVPGPGGPGAGRGGPGGSGRGEVARSAAFENEARPKDDGERKLLQGIDDILQKQGRRLNVPTADGRLLRLLVESIGAKQIVEFGTSNGISAIWMSLALRKTDGKLLTHEIDPNTAALARENLAAVGITDIVTVVVGDGHEKAKELKGPIDLVFIDADKEGYADYLKKTLPLVRPGGLIVAHNMNPRMAAGDFGKAITTNPDLETVFYMEGGGVSITLKKR